MNSTNIRTLVEMARLSAREARQSRRVFGRGYDAGLQRGEARAFLLAARLLKGFETQARSNNPLRRFAA